MGIQRIIRFPSGTLPTWEAIFLGLKPTHPDAVLRMIDGLPAFPNEIPEDTWQELRVGMSGEMITLRKSPSCITVVAWGNTTGPALVAYDALTRAVAEAGGGSVEE